MKGLYVFLVIAFLPGKDVCAQLNARITGDEKNGYQAAIYDADQLIVSNTGEFDLFLSNLDLSVRDTVSSWRAGSFTREGDSITLSGEMYLKEFDTNLSIRVTYDQINSGVIRKTVRLLQPSMPDLYFTMAETNRPAVPPDHYVTYENEHFPGGLVHELYPSAGFVTPQGKVIGFLTDPGYKNCYTRTTRRRFSGRGGGMIGMRILPDAELLTVATPAAQKQGQHFIRYTFGNMDVLERGDHIPLPLPAHGSREGRADISRIDSLISLKFKGPGKRGLIIPTPFRDQRIYTLSFSVRGDIPMALKLYRMHDGKVREELEHGIKYIDNFPVNSDTWSDFTGSVLVPYIEGDSIDLFIGTTQGKDGWLNVKNLKVTEHRPFKQSYNKLPLGQPVKKTTYIFSDTWKSQKEFIMASQAHLAEGMGFQGTQIEKMLYANAQMLIWITSVDDFTPFSVPNMNYSPDMYNRDSFWTVASFYNKELNLSIWNQWAKTQTPRGAIGTIITPYMGSVEAKDNEATIEWLIWALLNKRRFGYSPPQDRIRLAAKYILEEFDENKDGICASHFSMSQIDVMEYTPKTETMAVNQGMFVVALRTIRALGIPIEDNYLATAEKAYTDFYDPKRKHLLFDKEYPDLISLTDLIPEFLSLWVFDHPMLTDEMVINHLDQIPMLNKNSDAPYPETGTTAPICIRLVPDSTGYAYMDAQYQPFGEFGKNNYGGHSRDGFYYNGGSWLRAEYCAYVVGMKHGWKKAAERMENRLWAEVNLNPDWPYSKEFIPTRWKTTGQWWSSTRGLSWNVFVLMANELAGLRTPGMDPDFPSDKKGSKGSLEN